MILDFVINAFYVAQVIVEELPWCFKYKMYVLLPEAPPNALIVIMHFSGSNLSFFSFLYVVTPLI